MSKKIQSDPIEIANKIEHGLVRDGKRFFGEFMIEESVDTKVLVANVVDVMLIAITVLH